MSNLKIRMPRFGSLISLGLSLIFLQASCSLKPTKTSDIKPRNSDGKPQLIKISEATKVVDARSSFEYSMAHVPNSVSLSWKDFFNFESGQLDRDLNSISRRLAAKGLKPSDRVVILGGNLHGGMSSTGEGESGFIAWYLSMLGFENIELGLFENYRGRISNSQDDRLKSEKKWEAQVNWDNWVSNNKSIQGGFWSSEGKENEFWRSIYFGKKTPSSSQYHYVDARSFVLTNGLPNSEICTQLKEQGFVPPKTIFVTGEAEPLRGLAAFVIRKSCGWSALFVESPRNN